jgi:hypothetical protein
MKKTTHKMIPITTALAATLFTMALSGCSGAGPAPTTSKSAPTQPATGGCLRADGGCLGVLVPGSYKSENFNTFGAASAGQLAYKVSNDFWANALDHEAGYWFQLAKPYAAGNGDDFLPGVYVFADVAPALQKFPSCPEESDPSGPTDVSGLLSWTAALPGLRVTKVSNIQVGDKRASGIDILIDPATATNCSWGSPFVPVIASRPNASDAYMYGVSEGERERIYLADLGGGHTVGIILDAPTADFDALVAPALKLISTFTFTAP